MRINHHICCKNDVNLEKALQEHSIPFSRFSMGLHGDGPEYVEINIYEDNRYFSEIVQLANKGVVHTIKREYSKEELFASPWLSVRCFTQSIDLERDEEVFLVSNPDASGNCKHRKLITTSFYLRKPINWRKSHFASAYVLGNHHLFCDTFIKTLLESEGVPIEFVELRQFKTEMPIENVYYMNILNVLPESAISPSGIIDVKKCAICGAVHYQTDATYQLHLRAQYLTEQKGICKTPAVFAPGDYYAEPMNVVSNDLYRLLINDPHRIARNLVFEPVVLE